MDALSQLLTAAHGPTATSEGDPLRSAPKMKSGRVLDSAARPSLTHMRHQCWSQIGPNRTFVSAGSLRFEASELDHLGPFLGFIRYQFSKISRRARKHHTGALNETLDQPGIREACIDLLVELVD